MEPITVEPFYNYFFQGLQAASSSHSLGSVRGVEMKELDFTPPSQESTGLTLGFRRCCIISADSFSRGPCWAYVVFGLMLCLSLDVVVFGCVWL